MDKLSERMAAAKAAKAARAEVRQLLEEAGALGRKGRPREAESRWRRVVELQPDHAEALAALVVAALHRRDFAEAIRFGERAVALKPKESGWWSNLGVARMNAAERPGAIEAFRRALALKPGQAEILANLGVVLKDEGRFEEAREALEAALAQGSERAMAIGVLGDVLVELGEVEEGVGHLRRAAALDPRNGPIRRKLAMGLLQTGHLAEGWREYDWRFTDTAKVGSLRDLGEPAWQGEDLGEKALRIWSEQGIGDQILYASMLADALARTPSVHVECEARLEPLLRRSLPGLATIGSAPCRRGGAQIAMAGLGALLRPDFASFGSGEAFLKADPQARARIRARYEALAGGRPIVGIAWRSKNLSIGEYKSSRLADWGRILTAVPAFFVNLQYGDCAEEIAAAQAAFGVAIHQDAEVDQLADMDGFAAQIAALDQVVATSQTAVHLAGALGVPVFLMLTRARGLLWYWFLDREDSPWYRSARLFRQSGKGAWDDVFARVGGALAERFRGAGA